MRTPSLGLPCLGLAIAAIVGPAPLLAQAADPARATIQALDDGLIGIMKARGTQASRAATITPVIDRAFDLPLMTRLAVGPTWASIAPADQQALVAAFRRMTIAQYASNFDSWSGESFTVAPDVETRGTDKLVRTTLNQPKQTPVAIAYRLRQNGANWKIIDVFYRNAISQIATRRADFATVLSKGGAKALITHLNAIAAKGGD